MTTSEPIPFRRSRGMRDQLPSAMRTFRRVEDAFRDAAGHWGYEEIRTPTLETYSLFTVAGGLTPEALSRVYTFLDWDGWSGERIVVRPDSTIPVARAAVEAGMPIPARLSYVQSRFLFAENEDAEQWQCGLEFLGAPEITGDVEVATVGCDFLSALGLEPVLRLSHVGVTHAAAALVGGGEAPADLREVRSALSPDSPALAFIDAALNPTQGGRLARNLRSLAENSIPEVLPALDDLDRVASALVESGRRVVIDLSMPHDFEYYTGVVLEFEIGDIRVGSGGRYAPGWSGLTSTACGVALGVSPITMALGVRVPAEPVVSVVADTPEDYGRAVKLASALHRSGINASLDSSPGGPFAVRVRGEQLFAVRPEGQQELSSLDQLVELLIDAK
ncbi:MAG TPA: ATP phosphoribosyltransferase regulatory subunit [Dehalococcoidia bacterium]|nr:ATP phosphoribosyltransferase regulatory subunit [Dehalococcoidia bacterium]